MDFLLLLLDFFSLGIMTEALRAIIGAKSANLHVIVARIAHHCVVGVERQPGIELSHDFTFDDNVKLASETTTVLTVDAA